MPNNRKIFKCDKCGKILKDHTTGKPIQNVKDKWIMCWNGEHRMWVAGRNPSERVTPIEVKTDG